MHRNWNTLAYLPTSFTTQMPPVPYQYGTEARLIPQMPLQQMPGEQMPPQQIPRRQMPGEQMPGFDQQQETLPPPPVTPGEEIYTYPQNMAGALKLIEEAVAGENEDRLFYQYLIDKAPSEEEKEIIRGIRENEITHFGLFRQIYSQLTGKMLPIPENVPFEEPASYCEGLMRAIQGEQNAVIKYRKILFAMQNRVHINMLTEIITDEIRHGILYNYLYAKNNCRA